MLRCICGTGRCRTLRSCCADKSVVEVRLVGDAIKSNDRNLITGCCTSIQFDSISGVGVVVCRLQIIVILENHDSTVLERQRCAIYIVATEHSLSACRCVAKTCDTFGGLRECVEYEHNVIDVSQTVAL